MKEEFRLSLSICEEILAGKVGSLEAEIFLSYLLFSLLYIRELINTIALTTISARRNFRLRGINCSKLPISFQSIGTTLFLKHLRLQRKNKFSGPVTFNPRFAIFWDTLKEKRFV